MKKNELVKCPICKSGNLVEIVQTEEYIDVKSGEILDKYYCQDFPRYICKNCGIKFNHAETI
jgi:YgiT-type zinc finger domain-containing protein